MSKSPSNSDSHDSRNQQQIAANKAYLAALRAKEAAEKAAKKAVEQGKAVQP